MLRLSSRESNCSCRIVKHRCHARKPVEWNGRAASSSRKRPVRGRTGSLRPASECQPSLTYVPKWPKYGKAASCQAAASLASITRSGGAWRPCHYPHHLLTCLKFSNVQLIEVDSVTVIGPRFLTDAGHDQYLIKACPVGRIGICVGPTGGPTPHPASGENRHESGSAAWRHTAAGLSPVARTQSRLPFFQSTQGYLPTDSAAALATHPGGLPSARRVSVDRGHHRPGLYQSSGDRGDGPDWGWPGPGFALAHDAGRTTRGLGSGRSAPGDRLGGDGPTVLE